MTAETIKTKQITKRKPPADKHKAVDLVLNKGLSQTDAAKILKVKPNRVSQILQEVNADPTFLNFQNNKDKVFENLQYRLVNLADDDLLKSMLNKRGFTDAAILQDKIQQLRGQETQVNSTQIAVFINSVINRCAKDVPEVCQASESETNQVIDIPVIDGLLENLKDNK